ncbi:hypothetical protein A2U01_0014218, partial [Trifolium medium]|nr:hypothetical protein [Trifolium medium]
MAKTKGSYPTIAATIKVHAMREREVERSPKPQRHRRCQPEPKIEDEPLEVELLE